MNEGIVMTGNRALENRQNISGLLNSFLAAQDTREITRRAYRKGLERFLTWLAANQIIQPDRESVLRFKQSRSESGHSPNTIATNSYLVAMKRFFAYLEGIRKYPDIAKNVKGVKQAQGHLREPLTISRVRALLDSIDTSTVQEKRDFALINLMARTGLRTVEIVRANVEDIKQEGGEALLHVQGKGRDTKDAFVILTEKTLGPLLAYLRARIRPEPGEPLFTSRSDRNGGQRITTRTVRQIVKEGLQRIDIESRKISAHSLRHTFATLSLKTGFPLIQVKDALRHASIETTQKYLHNLDRIEKAAERYIDY